MMKHRILSCIIDPSSTGCLLIAPINLTVRYECDSPAHAPCWSLWYVADVSFAAVRVPLFRTTRLECGLSNEPAVASSRMDKETDSYMRSRQATVEGGESVGGTRYCLDVHVSDFADCISQIPEKYLSQVGLIQICYTNWDSQEVVNVKERRSDTKGWECVRETTVFLNIICHVKGPPAIAPCKESNFADGDSSHLIRCLYNPMS